MDRDETIFSHLEALIGFFLVYLKDFFKFFSISLNKFFQVGTIQNSFSLEQSSEGKLFFTGKELVLGGGAIQL